MPRAGIALGSNLGDRLANLRCAAGMLRDLAVPGEEFLTTLVYRTEPMHCPEGSPDFYNTVLELEYAGTAPELLAATRRIETAMGRVRGAERNAPRIIDLDLLYFGDEQWATEDLELPHPRIAERRFVLEPLADIRPDLVLPGTLETVAEMLGELPYDDAPLEALDEGMEIGD